MADTLLQAIISRFDTSAAATDVIPAGGLWTCEIPEEKNRIAAGVLYAVLWHEGEVPSLTTEDGIVEDGQFRFEVYGTSLVGVESLATKIKAAFDLPDSEANTYLPIVGAYVMSCTRGNYLVGKAEFRSAEGLPVYVAEIVYTTQVRKTI